MKNPTLRTDGFYHSGPVEWEDWHAGVHMRETHYHFWRFYPNAVWVHCYRSEPDFGFWEFTETLTLEDIQRAQRDGAPHIEDGLPLLSAGAYTATADNLTTYFEGRIPLSTGGERVFKSESHWTIRDDMLLCHDPEDNSELRFTRVPGEGADTHKRAERGN
jgi:hypothetical protein